MSSSSATRRFFAAYGPAWAWPLSSLLLQLVFGAFLGPLTPWVMLLTVALVAWRGGSGPGLSAALWATGLTAIVLLVPGSHFDAPSLLRAGFFGIETLAVALFAARLHSAQTVLTSRTYRQEALARISGLALAQTESTADSQASSTADSEANSEAALFVQAAQICAETLGISRAEIWPAPPLPPGAPLSFCESVRQAPGPLSFENFGTGGPQLPAELSGYRSALGVAIGEAAHSAAARGAVSQGASQGEGAHSHGVLLALSEEKRFWSVEERNFLSAIASILAVAAARSRSERQRRREEARYRAFVEQSSEGIWCFEFSPPLDPALELPQMLQHAFEHGALAECNEVFAHMLGYGSAAQLAGAPVAQFVALDDERNLTHLSSFLGSHFRLSEVELVELDSAGQRRPFVSNLVGILENGQLARVWGTQRDLSAQREADRALRASEERFRALFDASPIAISISRDDLMLYVNAAAVELLACDSPDQIIGHPVSEFAAPSDREMMMERIARRAQGAREPLIYEATNLRRDGTTRPLRIEIAPLALPDGPATLAFVFDLSEEKAAEAQRQELLTRERRAAQRAARLQKITAALAQTLSSEEVAQIIVEQGVGALDATSGALSVPETGVETDDETHGETAGDGSHMHIISSIGYSAEIIRDHRRLPMDPALPASRALLENRAFWLRNREEAIEQHPILAEIFPITGNRALCVLPLEVEGRALGVFSLAFDREQEFDDETRAFMLTLASQCAQALDRVRLLGEARDAARLQRESLALLNTLLDCAPIGLAFFDLQGRYVMLNSALAEISGVPIEAHLGRAAAVGLLGAEIEPIVRRVLESGKPSGEIEIVTAGLTADLTAGLANSAKNEGQSRARHCLASFYPVGTAQDEVVGVGAIVLDISARVGAERERVQLLGELEMERARFEAILQQMPSAVVIGEAPSGRLILSNSKVNEIFRGEFLAVSDIDQYREFCGFWADGRQLSPRDWPLARAIESGEVVRGEEVVLRGSDGQTSVIRLNAAPILDRDGQITAGVVVFDDVTQRARGESAQRFLATAASTLISVLDEAEIFRRLAQLCVPDRANWCIIAGPGIGPLPVAANTKLNANAKTSASANAGASANADDEANAEQPLSEGLLKFIEIAAPPAEAPEKVQRLRDALSQDACWPWDVDAVMRGENAVFFHDVSPRQWRERGASEEFVALFESLNVQSSILTPLAARGRILGVMIWLNTEAGRLYDDLDVGLAEELGRRAALGADNVRLYHEAETARDQAQEANRAKDEFLAVVSHELRTPLTPILGWLELLRAPGMDEAMRAQAFDVIERNARAQAQLINDILDVSRITTGKLRLEMRPVELGDWIEASALALLSSSEKDLKVQTQIEPVGPARIDANRIQQVVWNLLQNAIKFTPDGGQIEVRLKREGQTAIFEVQDSGQGIDPAFLPHVFDSFRQADSSSTRKNGGLGLGLAIVAHIIEGHGGRVRVQSEGIGRGATFSVELPLMNLATEAAVGLAAGGLAAGGLTAGIAVADLRRGEAAELFDGRLSGLKILIVDDEDDTRQMLQTVLETQGARVEAADSAPSALEALSRFSPDIFISDIGMPQTDGFALRRQLGRSFGAPSIALSAYTAPQDVQNALNAGFNKHLPKPVDASQLVAAVLDLLDAPAR